MAEVITINPGSFDQVLELKQLVITKGDKAQTLKTYVSVASIYGDVTVSPAPETQVNENTIMVQKINVTTYMYPGVTSRWRVVWGGDTYDITNVAPQKGTTFVVLEAVKLINNVAVQ